MKLASLLAMLKAEDLERLALEHVRTDELLSRTQLCNFLEGALHSYRFVSDLIANRQPPTFALLALLLDANGHQLPVDGLREKIMEETMRLAGLIDSGELLGRDQQLHLYRRAFYEARRNDLDLNGSEAAILAVLRRELGIPQVEHFLLEHHSDLREFWDKSDSFEHETNALRSAGLIFLNRDCVVMAEEAAPAVWQTLGIDMPTDSARRLLGYLNSADLANALEAAGSRTSGAREARLERLLTERIQPRAILRLVGLEALRNICRATGAPLGGNKDELIDRVIEHFAQRRDQYVEEQPEPLEPEQRRLDESRFRTLFGFLSHHELSDILRRRPDSRQTGTKDIRIRTLWETDLAEATLLSELMNRELENILHRLGLRLGGSKGDRVARIIEHFAETTSYVPLVSETGATALGATTESPAPSPELRATQELFRQKSSSPQGSLQPWLEELLEAKGLVRCYATEDANPTKQLKNKLSQAAAAHGGILVLLLTDQDAFFKTREALVERWRTNDEWSKSVACVGLSYPLSNPEIHTIVEMSDSAWPSRIRERLFDQVVIHRVESNESAQVEDGLVSRRCPQCDHLLSEVARFCSQCGRPVGA